MKWFQDGAGNTSSIRIMAMMSTVTGCLTVLGSVVAAFLINPDAVGLAAIGAGMAGIGEFAKVIQARGGS